MAILAPLAAALPEGPDGEAFTAEQWTTLLAIMDTVIPSIRRETASTNPKSHFIVSEQEYDTAAFHLQKTVVDPPDRESLDKYLDERPSDNPRFQDLLKRTLVFYGREDSRKGLALVLSTLK